MWNVCPSMPGTPGAKYGCVDTYVLHAWKCIHRWGLGNVTRSKKATSRNAWCGELGDMELAVQHPERWRHLVPVPGKEDQRSESKAGLGFPTIAKWMDIN